MTLKQLKDPIKKGDLLEEQWKLRSPGSVWTERQVQFECVDRVRMAFDGSNPLLPIIVIAVVGFFKINKHHTPPVCTYTIKRKRGSFREHEQKKNFVVLCFLT
jgi:hypothetical protein